MFSAKRLKNIHVRTTATNTSLPASPVVSLLSPAENLRESRFRRQNRVAISPQPWNDSQPMTTSFKHNLLVVDDEEGPRESIRMVFRNDYNIHMTNGGEQALGLIREIPIDVAIVDIRMCGMSGIDFLRAIKERDPHIEVIIFTAYETLETARQAIRLGARDYIGKPFDVETLRRSVANALMHRKISLRIETAEKELARISTELERSLTRADMAATINEIYAGVLHDINNPLTIINCFLDLMMDRVANRKAVDEQQLEEMRDQLSTISRQIKICSEISNRHLDFIQRPNPASKAPVNLILNDLRQLIKVHPIIRSGDIQVELLESDAMVAASEAELTQMLLNLMINALQSSGETHGVRVDAREIRQPLDIPSLKEAPGNVFLHEDVFANKPPFIAITVSDRAGGIPEDIVEDIFEPYFTTKPRDKGTGLGLSMVSRLLRNRAGALHLRSVHGTGSAFTLFLPASEECGPVE